jgi:hypothetical protein
MSLLSEPVAIFTLATLPLTRCATAAPADGNRVSMFPRVAP